MSGLNLRRSDLLKNQCLVAGEWVDASSGETIEVINPATGRVLGTVPNMGREETLRAVVKAEEVRVSWVAETAKERAGLLRKWFELVLDNKEDLAHLMTAEQGKPLAESRGEIEYAASFIEWFSEEAKRVYGDVIPAVQSDKRILVIKQGIGVCAAITPWNFPAAMITRKAGPALAAGCSMVIKPASQTPLSALALCVLAEEAGLPKGLLSCITGSASAIGGELTSNSVVKKLSFTGSTDIGKILLKQCADTVKKTSMELGGNAPFIVFEDSDIDLAVQGAISSKFRNAGQTCVCANRIFVQSGVYENFIRKLVAAASQLRVGDGLESDTDIGPLIDTSAVAKVEGHIRDALEKNGKIVLGGKSHEKGGAFFEPTIIAEADQKMKIFREETFGPVAPVFRFETEDEVIRKANDTEFGLASYLYSNDIARIWRVLEALEYGIVGVNEGIISTEVAPFGGVKESGLGREGSKYGIDDYLELKYVCLGGIKAR